MNKNKKHLLIVLILLLVLCVVICLCIKRKDKDEEVKFDIDVNDANNVPTIDSKLGEDIRITQNYLINYTVKKAGIWYKSHGVIKDIKKKGYETIYTIGDEKSITASISSDKAVGKKGDTLYFVGSINLKSKVMSLAKVDLEDFQYSSAEDITDIDLATNIENLKVTYFIVSGYMVTDNNKYKLYDSKESYLENEQTGHYFLLNWKEQSYTGNGEIKVKCLIDGTFELKECVSN